MDKSWLSSSRTSAQYGAGVKQFVNVAVASSGYQKKIICPCKNCANRYWHTPVIIEDKKFQSGTEVGLISPNSAQVVALATVQNVDEKSTGLDGISLSGYIQVLVNVVLKSTTQLPRAHGRVTHLGHAQGRCIPWPKENVTETYMTHEYASTISEMDKNLRRYSKVTSIADESPSQLVAEKTILMEPWQISQSLKKLLTRQRGRRLSMIQFLIRQR